MGERDPGKDLAPAAGRVGREQRRGAVLQEWSDLRYKISVRPRSAAGEGKAREKKGVSEKSGIGVFGRMKVKMKVEVKSEEMEAVLAEAGGGNGGG